MKLSSKGAPDNLRNLRMLAARPAASGWVHGGPPDPHRGVWHLSDSEMRGLENRIVFWRTLAFGASALVALLLFLLTAAK